MSEKEQMKRRLIAFAREVLVTFYNDGDVGDLDGAWLEEKAHEHDLVLEVGDSWMPKPEALK